MFGFSPTKILFTVIAIGLVWYGFRWYARYQAGEVERARRRPVNGESKGGQKGASGAAEDMTRCDVCGSYVVASQTRACGKEGCPFPG